MAAPSATPSASPSKSPNAGPPVGSPAPAPKKGRFGGWISGVVSQQREMAYPSHVAELNKEVFSTYKGLFNGSIKPKRVESFEDAVVRMGLTDKFLAQQLERLKNLHVVMYCLGGLVLVYAFWLAMSSFLLFGAVSAFWGLGILVRGYIYGYRAWQIQNRDLIRLQDAIKIKSTYLVL